VPGSHNRLSPSRSKRYEMCPGSLLREEEAERKRGPQEETPAMREGIRAHQLLEHCLENLIQPHKVEELVDELGIWVPPKDMVQHIQNTIDYLGGRQIATFPCDVTAERRVDPAVLTGCEEQGGTADVQLLSTHRRTYEVVDLKYGAGIKVSADKNTQLELYAIGALAEILAKKPNFIFDDIRLTIIQPRIPNPDGSIHQTVLYTQEQLLARAKEIGAAGQLALSGFGPIVPGVEQCRFCQAKMDCDERAAAALNSEGLEFGDLTKMEPGAILAKSLEVSDQDPKAMSDERLAAVLDGFPALESFIRDMRAEAKARLTKGRKLPGYKLVAGRRSRSWNQDDEELRKSLKKLGLRVKDFQKSSVIGVSALRTLLPESKIPAFDELWSWEGGKPSVAIESDERPAIGGGISFGPIEAAEAS
jgi:hypothetical protein